MNTYRLRLVEQTIQEASADFEVEATSASEAAGLLAAARDTAAAQASKVVEIQGQAISLGPSQTLDTPVFYFLLDEDGDERGEVHPRMPSPQTDPAGPPPTAAGQDAVEPVVR
jgi:hypothetical protein